MLFLSLITEPFEKALKRLKSAQEMKADFVWVPSSSEGVCGKRKRQQKQFPGYVTDLHTFRSVVMSSLGKISCLFISIFLF